MILATHIIWSIAIIFLIVFREKFRKLAKDKQLHFWIILGFGILTLWLCMLTHYFVLGNQPGTDTLKVFGFLILLAAGKELIIDKLLKLGQPEWLDFMWSALAAFAISFLYVLPILDSVKP